MSKQIVYTAESRGHAQHGWLDTYHTFSFANYYDPQRIHFGNLRVINDDFIARGKGFGTHPHDNMEIITIPLSGAIQHKDSMGTSEVIKSGEIQVMSAGTGIYHSEFNPSDTEDLNIFQIWIFPKKENVTPRYGQMSLDWKHNEWNQVVSPNASEQATWINQDAWITVGEFESNKNLKYQMHQKGQGVWAMLVEGEAEINGTSLKRRDSIGIWETENIDIKTLQPNTKIMLIEVPMQLPDFLIP